MTAHLLEVTDLHTHFETRAGTVKSVDGVSFYLERGEILGLVGESGSGKSITGFSLIGLIDKPGRITQGSIKLEGRELVGLSETELRKLRGREISMVFQDPMMTLNPVLTVLDQMTLALRAHEKLSDSAARIRCVEALRRVRIVDPEHKVDFYPHQFSGGMRQRVAIAIALLHNPKVVIADEPTTALDVSVQAEILTEVKALVAELGISMIWISHDLATVASISKRIAVMKSGKIIETGLASDVLKAPSHPYTQGLLDALPSRSKPGQMLGKTAEDETVLLTDTAPAAEAVPDFVTVRNAVKRFEWKSDFWGRLGQKIGLVKPTKPVIAVNHVDLTIARGEALGLVGESGSGKSTLGRMVCGIYQPTEGEVRLSGQPVMSDKVHGRKLTTKIQMIFQDPFASLDPRRTIGQSIAEGPIAHGLTTKGEARAYVAHWLRAVSLDPAFADRYPHQFSGGQRQRIAIARALAMKPEVIVCDEPVASLDVSIQAQILNLLLRLRKELNLTLLFISHDLSVVRHLCDRIIVMHHGKIVEEGIAEAIFETPQQPYTKMLLNAIPKLA
ncbi:ABC transporter ATP-binding protein [Pseudochrobactrum sp. sp1633]|uniref:dipeptide ABC transporter ATP-binding protein n=1 Tax=Pseudochrobactrum sp. sp1633 TaxID=3036706 RepID=UPI0025A51C53|nr:ABC transporter ATP-binding protein [Pseudochrobactrum sp. sp1633]MDM8346786.1 ABC transporter ATP-binding protein [Pseudochrobactrum sp. sp1633]HWD14059.1 ABC transporter ATP-binding protein [Pseudochrobactrum sp.]